MPFRKAQFYVSYKSIEQGSKPEPVEAKNTSRTCPYVANSISRMGASLSAENAAFKQIGI